MIEGQPQRNVALVSDHGELSGLVIEGQPQRHRPTTILRVELSGLVIEGQPQRRGFAVPAGK